MSTACIFVGPTLSTREVEATLRARCLPPVAQGDVVRAVKDHRPQAIGIVDGFFGGAPAVWHKEILWAMAEGVAVFGAASMGALRAAELHVFGMQGIGRIFEDYLHGRLEDDDEVAVVHAPAEMGYTALSEPMVNIRATLARAEQEGVLPAPARACLEARAKALHFPERSWGALLEDEGGPILGASARALFQDWLRTGRVDLKRADALAMLEAMGQPGAGLRPDAIRFHLETTHFLAGLASEAGSQAQAGFPGAGTVTDPMTDLVLDELRLGDRSTYEATTSRALLAFASGKVIGDRSGDSQEAVARKVDAIRVANGLFDHASLEAWLSSNDLDPDALHKLAAGAAHVDDLADLARPSLAVHVLNALKLSGDYPRLAKRARRKAARLAAEGTRASAGAIVPGSLALRLWFSAKIGLPDDAGLDAILQASGFADATSLDRVLQRERLYVTLIEPDLDD